MDDARPTTIAWHGISLVVLKRGDRYVAAHQGRGFAGAGGLSRAELVRAQPELPA